MWRRTGACWLLTALLAALVLLWGAPAWADPELRLSPAAGPAGSEVTVTGTGFDAAEVEIRWGSRSGPVLGTAAGPDFSTTFVVPDSPPNSYPVVAVVTDGNSVTTSNASFQLTPASEPAPAPTPPAAGEPVETTTPTTAAPERPPTTSPSGREPATDAIRSGGVGGGLDPSLADTVGDNVPGSAGTVAGSPAAADAARATAEAAAAAAIAAAGGGITASPDGGLGTTSLPGGSSSTGVGSSTGPGTGDAGETRGRGRNAGNALGPTSTSQSSGAVRSPALLFAGLGMIMAGAAFLAFRNRHRLGASRGNSEGPPPIARSN